MSEDSLELLTFLLPPPNLCDYKYALGYLVYVVLGSKLGACSANVLPNEPSTPILTESTESGLQVLQISYRGFEFSFLHPEWVSHKGVVSPNLI